MKILPEMALTYDDVLMVPQFYRSRFQTMPFQGQPPDRENPSAGPYPLCQYGCCGGKRNMWEGNDLIREEIEEYVAEAVKAVVPYRGKAREVLLQLMGGLQSAMSNSGERTIEELQQKAVFVRMTGAGLKESGLHDVDVWA